MHPVLYQFGPVTVYTYGVLAAVGFLVGLWYARRQAPKAGLNPDRIWSLGIYGILVALVTAKIWFVLSSWNYYLENPREIFSMTTFQSAGTFYGGVLGALVWGVLYTHFQKMPRMITLDVATPAIALGHAIGRLGCFAAGCCYGKPTSLPWGVTFTNPVAAQIAGTPLHASLHPTQLYESAAEFLNFFLLVLLGSRKRFNGQVFGAYCVLYGVERGLIEFLRGDPGRTMMFHDAVSLMQIVSVGLVFLGAFLWWRGMQGASPVSPGKPARAAAGRT
jgi:phosphatidylglycerol:prolipoprotein diacylglycerol transferase